METELAAALARGALVALWQPVAGGSVEASRRAARALHDRVAASLPPLRLRASRSATPGWAGVAFSVGQPVGLDVERIDPALRVDAALRAAALGAAEPPVDDAVAFAETWVRKEALLKAAGVGLALPPQHVAAGARNDDWSAVRLPTDQTVWVRSLVGPQGCAAALATLGDTRPVICRWLPP